MTCKGTGGFREAEREIRPRPHHLPVPGGSRRGRHAAGSTWDGSWPLAPTLLRKALRGEPPAPLPCLLPPVTLTEARCQGAADTAGQAGLPGPRAGCRRGRLGWGVNMRYPASYVSKTGSALPEPHGMGSSRGVGKARWANTLGDVLYIRRCSESAFFDGVLRARRVLWPLVSCFIRGSSRLAPGPSRTPGFEWL